ncbi:MAG: acetyl-CoA C-acetyltransferase [Oscillospiraceae bacterium]|jgi:acetyl-CoA C-acetyltransferase|nr:acetyl-CoA C-acetyltransferase [Oscillospiraceae bacterium]
MKVYIVSAKRTPIGSFNGTLSSLSVSRFASVAAKSALDASGIDPAKLDEVIIGHVLTAGCGQGPARQTALGAGVPIEVPASAVAMVCGSGMKAIHAAYANVKAGLGELYLAGGMESMSRAPYIIQDARTGFRMGHQALTDTMLGDGLTDAFSNLHMGITAENIAKKYEITRQQQDEFAINSQKKAIAAVDSGAFAEEIAAVQVKVKKDTITFDKDEYPNRATSLEKLSALRPAFLNDGTGTVTAGNASGINDGAAFVTVASEEAVKKYGLTPIAEIVSVGIGGVEPSVMGMGPVPAIAKALSSADLKLADVGLIELNEAFAAQSLGVVRELEKQHGLSEEEILARTNLNGGAIALGHPVGASGARIVVTLAHLLKKPGSRYGLASLCIGGGMGAAVVLKKA